MLVRFAEAKSFGAKSDTTWLNQNVSSLTT
jgi:hypothetical protein